MPSRTRKTATAAPAKQSRPSEEERLRGILWEIVCLTGRNEDLTSAPEGHVPDIPEWALAAVAAVLAEYEDYNGVKGIDLASDAGPDEICTCGQRITWYQGAWLHIFNPVLGDRRGHSRAVPGRGYYEPPETIDDADDPDDDDDIQPFDIPVPPPVMRTTTRARIRMNEPVRTGPTAEELEALRRNLEQTRVHASTPTWDVTGTQEGGYRISPIPPRIEVTENNPYRFDPDDMVLRRAEPTPQRREPIAEEGDDEDANPF